MSSKAIPWSILGFDQRIHRWREYCLFLYPLVLVYRLKGAKGWGQEYPAPSAPQESRKKEEIIYTSRQNEIRSVKASSWPQFEGG